MSPSAKGTSTTMSTQEQLRTDRTPQNESDSTNGETFIKKHWKKLGAGVLVVAAGTATLIGIGLGPKTEAQPPVTDPVPTEPVETPEATGDPEATADPEVDSNLSITEQVEARVAARPEIGSEAYMELFDSIELPDASVTDPEVLLDAYTNITLVEWPKLLLSDAPERGDDKVISDWTFDESYSLGDVVNLLDINYYTKGIMDKLYGPGWEDRPSSVSAA